MTDFVVLLHGSERPGGLLRALSRRLAARSGMALWPLGSRPGAPLATASARLAEQLAELPWRSPIHLVGLGREGVVARCHAQQRGDGRIVQTISVDAPFAGGPQRAPEAELHPQSPLLHALELGARRAFVGPHLSIVTDGGQGLEAPPGHGPWLPGGDRAVLRGPFASPAERDDRVARLVAARVWAGRVTTLRGRWAAPPIDDIRSPC